MGDIPRWQRHSRIEPLTDDTERRFNVWGGRDARPQRYGLDLSTEREPVLR